LDEQTRWNEYPVVFLTPDIDRWNPHVTHYAEAKASMLDSGGNIVSPERNQTTIFDEADIGVMYAEPATWEVFDSIVDAIIIEDDHYCSEGPSMTDENDDDESKLNGDGIWAQLASLSTVHELPTFSRNISDLAYISHYLSMTFGSPTRNDESCDMFETYVTALARLNHGAEGNISIAADRSHRVTAEHLSKSGAYYSTML